MKDFFIKLKFIYLPFIIIAVSIIIGYTFLDWLFFHKWQLFSLKKILIEFVIPAILTFFCVFVWLRPRIKILNLYDKKGDDRFYFLYLFIAVFAIGIPVVIAQDYLENSTGNLVKLNTINEIYEKAPDKYYEVDNFFLDKNGLGIQSNFSIGDKGHKLFMEFFCAVPIYASEFDPLLETVPYAWYGIKYTHSVRNSLSDEEKEAEFRKFAADTENKFKYVDLYKFNYLRKEGDTYDRDLYEKAVRYSPAYKNLDVPLIILMPEEDDFDKRAGNSLWWIFITSLVGAVAFFVMVTIPKIRRSGLNRFKKGKGKDLKNAALIFFEPFRPQEDFVVVPVLLIINIVIYLIMAIVCQNPFEFSSEMLIRWGAQSNSMVLENHEYWRLFTSQFIHAGLMHIGMNMISLYFAGVFMESILGKKWFIVLYLLSGICASLLSVYWNTKGISIGASGAIMGLYGAFAAFLITRFFGKGLTAFFSIYIGIFVGINLLAGLSGGIDNAAHIGGLLSGFIAGLILRFALPYTDIEGDYRPGKKNDSDSKR